MNRLIPLLFGLILTSLAWSDDLVDGENVESTHVVMHKNPSCGCCDLWAEHLRSYGFTVESIEDPEIVSFKADRNIPGPLMSCDILKLLKEKPEHVTGIAVPGMPLGSPGMEHPRPQDFKTIALLTDGTAYVFESHAAGEDFSAK
jgi:hypothetical protein